MSDKIRGIVAVLVGAFALFQAYRLYQAGQTDWHLWVEGMAGVLLIALGAWRFSRRQVVSNA